jgi:hypothetical protein
MARPRGVIKNEMGQRYRFLTVTAPSPRIDDGKRFRAHWICRCDCGKETVVLGDHLRNGSIQSCGCFHASSMAERQKMLFRARGAFERA